MTLIDGDRIMTAWLYDDEHREFIEKKMSIIDCINAYTEEGITESDVVEQTEWIPVSERLPEKSEYGKVLVTYVPSGGTLWKKVIIAHYSDLMGIAKPSFHVGEVGKKSFRNITEQVIAWMPLPEPYRAESGCKE